MNNARAAKADLAVQEYLWNRGRITFLYIIAILLVVVMLSVYVWQYIRMVEIQMDIKELDKEKGRIKERLVTLQLEKARLSRLERIDIAAQERLGMHAPAKENVIYLSTSGRMKRSDESGLPQR